MRNQLKEFGVKNCTDLRKKNKVFKNNIGNIEEEINKITNDLIKNKNKRFTERYNSQVYTNNTNPLKDDSSYHNIQTKTAKKAITLNGTFSDSGPVNNNVKKWAGKIITENDTNFRKKKNF